MPENTSTPPWLVSLHGGHSSRYCDHASSTLESMLEAACARGMRVYGITEHAPRIEERHLYPEERAMGWTLDTLREGFAAYAAESREMVTRYAGRLEILRGFEAEIVPVEDYAEHMLRWRAEYGFDYMVGSVHYFEGELFDYTPGALESCVQRAGSLETFVVQYYESVARMLEALRPEVAGHLDVFRKLAKGMGPIDTLPIRRAAIKALEAAKTYGVILDINTAGYRKGLGIPYPDAWLVSLALEMGVAMCFGDDSHAVDHVGTGIREAREWLLSLGVGEITVLRRAVDGVINKENVPLE